MAYNSYGATLPSYPAGAFTSTGGVINLNNTDLGTIVSSILPYIYVFAGLALFVMLIWGGITLMTAAGDPAKSKDGYGKLSAGLIGFLIIFVSYFVVQVVEVVLGIKIL